MTFLFLQRDKFLPFTDPAVRIAPKNQPPIAPEALPVETSNGKIEEVAHKIITPLGEVLNLPHEPTDSNGHPIDGSLKVLAPAPFLARLIDETKILVRSPKFYAVAAVVVLFVAAVFFFSYYRKRNIPNTLERPAQIPLIDSQIEEKKTNSPIETAPSILEIDNSKLKPFDLQITKVGEGIFNFSLTPIPESGFTKEDEFEVFVNLLDNDEKEIYPFWQPAHGESKIESDLILPEKLKKIKFTKACFDVEKILAPEIKRNEQKIVALETELSEPSTTFDFLDLS